MIKEEVNSELQSQSINGTPSVIQNVGVKQMQRQSENIVKDEIQIMPSGMVEQDTTGRFKTSFEDFKKLMLACLWGKRLNKSEIIMVNLIQNVQLLTQAVESDDMPLKQALQILEGLQKVYSR